MLTEFKLKPGLPERTDVDLLVIGVKAGALDDAPIRSLDAALKGEVIKEITRRGFNGRAGGSLVLPAYGAITAPNLLLFGLGGEPQAQNFRLLGEAAVQNAQTLRARTAAVTAHGLSSQQIGAIPEHVELSAYRLRRYK